MIKERILSPILFGEESTLHGKENGKEVY